MHPLRADADCADSIPPTLFPRTFPGPMEARSDIAFFRDRHPAYQKRSGVAALMGAYTWNNDSGQAASYRWGTLPAALRPTTTHSFLCAVTLAPWVTSVWVTADGDVWVDRPDISDSAGDWTGYLDGITYPTA